MSEELLKESITFLEPIRDDQEKIEHKNGLPLLCHAKLNDPLWEQMVSSLSNPVTKALIELFPTYIPSSPCYVALKWDYPLARKGFIIKEGSTQKEYPQTYYVTLDTCNQALKNGAIEEIFPHELSHLFVIELLGEEVLFSRFRSTRMHLTTSTTDEALAFFEGWGNHFQTLSWDYTQNSSFKERYYFDSSPLSFWCCAREDSLRLRAVKENRFIHPPHETVPKGELEDWYRNHVTNNEVQETTLKNANQLLSSEGVLASFFYYLARENLKREMTIKEHYKKSISTLKEMGRLLEPLKNEKKDHLLSSPEPLISTFIKTYGEVYPKEGEEIYSIFLNLTRFVPFSSLLNLYQEIYRAGRHGHIPLLKEKSRVWQEKTRELLKLSLEQNEPCKAYGPTLWMKSPIFQVGAGLWIENPKVPFTFDLNAAQLFDLITIPGIHVELAYTILQDREERGLFSSLEDLFTRITMSSQSKESIEKAARTMAQERPFNYI